jgi:hypothetical protein
MNLDIFRSVFSEKRIIATLNNTGVSQNLDCSFCPAYISDVCFDQIFFFLRFFIIEVNSFSLLGFLFKKVYAS